MIRPTPLSARARSAALATSLLAMVLAACSGPSEPTAPTPTQSGEGDNDAPVEQVSIMRPDAEIDRAADTLAPLELRVGFDDGGTELDETAQEALRAILAAPQLQTEGPIILRGHSDSAGSDAANLRASRTRAEAVQDWLIDNGVAPARIRIIAMGEQNPAKPNALPDGSPNEEGRAFNRRVDVTVGKAKDAQTEETEEPQTLVERVASDD